MLILIVSLVLNCIFKLKNAVGGICAWNTIGTEPAATCASFNGDKDGCEGAGAGDDACTWTAQGFRAQPDALCV